MVNSNVLEVEKEIKKVAKGAKTVAYGNRLFVIFPNDFRVVGVLNDDSWDIMFQYKEFEGELAWRCDTASSEFDVTSEDFISACLEIAKLDKISA